MNRKAPGLAFLLVGTVAIGCGGGGAQKFPEAGTNFDAKPEQKPDAGGPEVTGSMTGDGSRLLIPGSVVLIGSGPDSCTNQVPAPGDRWCAFTKPSTLLGFNDLWVINVTKAAAGATIKCDTSDANCVRLTSGLFEDPSIGFRIHGFDGDTLIYYAELGPTAVDQFVGPIYGWRPGWTGGRKLTSDTGVVCSGHPRSATALCFEGRDDSISTQVSFELHAGIMGPVDTGPLPKVDKLLIGTDKDAMGVRKFQADLSDDGAYVAWSARADALGVESLNVQKVGDDASRIAVAQDVSRWTISPDAKKWYWLKKFNYDLNGAESGTLEVANFPKGDVVSTLAAGVADYSSAGDTGVLLRSSVTQGVGDLTLVADRAAPATVKVLDKSVLGVLEQSKDGTKAIYTKTQTLDGLFDLFIGSSTATVPCPLASTPIAAPIGTFISAGGIVAWARINGLTNQVEGMYTTASDCHSRKFAADIFRWLPVSDEGYVFLDTINPDGSDEATLRYAKVASGALPATGTVVQTLVASVFAPLLPTLPAVVYTVGTRTSADGLYINATLPFTTMPVVPPPDAGPATDGSSDGTSGGDVGAASDAGDGAGGNDVASGTDAAAGETGDAAAE
jgi:hypothetical protein